MEPTQTRKTNLQVEDLLRLKREERPSPEFWDAFEQSLRQRTWRSFMNPKKERQLIPLAIKTALVGVPASAFVLALLSFFGAGQHESSFTSEPNLVNTPFQVDATQPLPQVKAILGKDQASPSLVADLQTQGLKRRFVVDVIPNTHEARSAAKFRTVHSAALPLKWRNDNSTRYVEDSLAIPLSSQVVAAKPAFSQF